MGKIAIVGPSGAGKSNLARSLREAVPEARYVPMSVLSTVIPLTLMINPPLGCEQMKSLPGVDEYLDRIFAVGSDVKLGNFSREEKDAHIVRTAGIGGNNVGFYGPEIFARIAIRATKDLDCPAIIDNVPKLDSVRELVNQQDIYVVGLDCDWKTRLKRQPVEVGDRTRSGEDLEAQMRRTDEIFHSHESLAYLRQVEAHSHGARARVFNTSGVNFDNREIVDYLVGILRR